MPIEIDEPLVKKSTRRKPSVSMKVREPPKSNSADLLSSSSSRSFRVQVTRLSVDEIRDIREKLKSRLTQTINNVSLRSTSSSSSKSPHPPVPLSKPDNHYQIGEHVFARGQNNQYYPSRIKEIETMAASRAQLFSVEMFEPRVANKLAIMSNVSRKQIALGDLLTESDIVLARSIKPGQRVLFLHESKFCEGAFVKIDEQPQQQQQSSNSSLSSLANAIFVIDSLADQTFPSQESNSSVIPTQQRFL